MFYELYYYDVQICLAKSILKERNTPANIKRFDGRFDYDGAGLYSFNQDKGVGTIFLVYNTDAGTIAHECWHCVKRMFEYVGAHLDNELVAYTLGYLVNEVNKLKQKK